VLRIQWDNLTGLFEILSFFNLNRMPCPCSDDRPIHCR
jgi:hypothetical protein